MMTNNPQTSISKPQTLRIITPNGNSLYLYDVVKFSLNNNEDYWIIQRSNNNYVFVHKSEVGVIGYNDDIG